MGRPPLEIGTYGKIRAYRTPSGWRAETYFRDADGVTRPVKRAGDTRAKAERRLKADLVERGHHGGAGLGRETLFAEVAELWLAEVQRRRRGTTADTYRRNLDCHVLPAFGRLRLRECTTRALDRYVRELETRLKPNTVRTIRTVLSGVLAYAVRMDAIGVNPVRGVAPIEGGARPSRAFTRVELADFLAQLDADPEAVAADLPDLLRYLLGTGVRIGEALGMRWEDVDLDEALITHGSTLVRQAGVGLVLHPPKTEAGFRVLPAPDFVMMLLRLRYPGGDCASWPVFPSCLCGSRRELRAGRVSLARGSGWRDPNNTGAAIRRFRARAGYPWFTSHNCRKTTITMLDKNQLTPRAISGYAGHSKPSFTMNTYMDRRPEDRAAGEALDAAMRPVREQM